VVIRDPAAANIGAASDPYQEQLNQQAEFQEVQEAFTVWLAEFKEEDLKLFKLCLLGIVATQLVLWGGTADATTDCGIPITQWLTVFNVFLALDAFLIGRKLFLIDSYLERLIARPFAEEARGRLLHTLERLKSLSIGLQVSEVLQVAWLLRGLSAFYSEANVCSWEKSHSLAAYVLMFVMLTLGFMLILKWAFKLLAVALILATAAKTLIQARWTRMVSRLRGAARNWEPMNPGPQRVSSLSRRLRAPLRPEVYQVESLL
jgi:hypothetical protein